MDTNLSTSVQDYSKDQAFLERLHEELKPHLIRRFKRDVIKDMPMRKEVIVRVEMTQNQKDTMKRLITENVKFMAGDEKQNDSKKGYMLLFTYLRQIALHTQLLGPIYCTDNFRASSSLKRFDI